MPLVLARPLALDARTRFSAASLYTRGGIAALAMIGALFVALRLSPAGNNPDQRFLRDLAAMEGLERVAQQSFNEAINQFGSHQLTTSEVAQRIDSEVLPRWFLIQRTVQKDRVADDSKLKPLWELIDDYSESRMAAFQLFESGYRQGRAADFRAAQAKLDQGNVDLKLISDLRQRPK